MANVQASTVCVFAMKAGRASTVQFRNHLVRLKLSQHCFASMQSKRIEFLLQTRTIGGAPEWYTYASGSFTDGTVGNEVRCFQLLSDLSVFIARPPLFIVNEALKWFTVYRCMQITSTVYSTFATRFNFAAIGSFRTSIFVIHIVFEPFPIDTSCSQLPPPQIGPLTPNSFFPAFPFTADLFVSLSPARCRVSLHALSG